MLKPGDAADGDDVLSGTIFCSLNSAQTGQGVKQPHIYHLHKSRAMGLSYAHVHTYTHKPLAINIACFKRCRRESLSHSDTHTNIYTLP